MFFSQIRKTFQPYARLFVMFLSATCLVGYFFNSQVAAVICIILISITSRRFSKIEREVGVGSSLESKHHHFVRGVLSFAFVLAMPGGCTGGHIVRLRSLDFTFAPINSKIAELTATNGGVPPRTIEEICAGDQATLPWWFCRGSGLGVWYPYLFEEIVYSDVKNNWAFSFHSGFFSWTIYRSEIGQWRDKGS